MVLCFCRMKNTNYNGNLINTIMFKEETMNVNFAKVKEVTKEKFTAVVDYVSEALEDEAVFAEVCYLTGVALGAWSVAYTYKKGFGGKPVLVSRKGFKLSEDSWLLGEAAKACNLSANKLSNCDVKLVVVKK